MKPREILPQSAAIAACAARIDGATDVAELAACARQAQPSWSRRCIASRQATPARRWSARLLSRLNDAVTERVLMLLADRFRLPAGALVLARPRLGGAHGADLDHRPGQRPGVFGQPTTARRATCANCSCPSPAPSTRRWPNAAFPLCDGEVMAGNPRWCLSIAEWLTNFGAWVRTPEPEALLNASIFFDFRALAGDAALAREMRAANSANSRAAMRSSCA
jgi:CBS domain-containing protein